MREGDIVNVVSKGDWLLNTLVLSDRDEMGDESKSPGLFIVHPDRLISGTAIVGSIACPRRTILQQFWPAGDPSLATTNTDGVEETGNTGGQHVMLAGSIIHDTFQQVTFD